MAKFCPDCGNPLGNETSKFCDKCGAKIPINSPNEHSSVIQSHPSTYIPPVGSGSSGQIPAQQQGPTIAVPKKSRSTLEWIAIIFGGFILLVVITAFVAGMAQGVSSSNAAPTLSVTEIKSQAQLIPYSNLMRQSDDYSNSLVYFRGKVAQVQNSYGNNYVLRIDTKQDPFVGYYGDTIWVDYTGDRLLEDDIIDVWGRFRGLKTYTAVLGNDITIPEINALHVEIVKEYTSSSSATSGVVTTVTPTPTKTGWVYDPETGSYKKV
jgi:hypothetical protein